MRRFIVVLIVVSALFGGCYNRHNDAPVTKFAEGANSTLGALGELCANGLYAIDWDMICVGRITSSDSEGNFYRSIVVEDESGAVEIKLGLYNIASQYPEGLLVALHLNNTATLFENGVIQIGLPPQSFDESPREMESQAVIDNHIVRSNSVNHTTPLVCNIAGLDNGLCGRFVALENLHYAPIEGEENQEYFRFVDSEGKQIFVYVSPYADFAGLEFSATERDIRGILYYESVGMNIGKQFVIKPRYKDDIATADGTL